MATQLSSQVKDVQTNQKEIERSVAQLDSERDAHQIELEEIRQHTTELQQMLGVVEEHHLRNVIPQFQRLDDTTEQLQHALDEVKTTAGTSETALRTLSAKFHSSTGALATQLQQQHRHFEVSTGTGIRCIRR